MLVNLDSPFQAFSDHLTKPNNERVLFSGPFGYGKTYFLNYFFSLNTQYKPFWLSPVKYIVGQNEDIFEYIKIDIALQLLVAPELTTSKTPKFREDLYIHQYLRNKPYEIALLLSQALNDLSIPIVKQVASSVSNGIKAREKYEIWKEEWKQKNKTDFEKLIDFSLSHNSVKGSVFEDDIITQLIRLSLSAVKQKTESENVLVIDDFDRLDPEHIFRILNILSVHQNYLENENKFGFDKIIVVCSVENIRNIYEYKYGKNVDFDGYIEKFYSTDIFHFNNQSAIAYFCESEFSASLDEDCLLMLGIILSYFVSNKYLSIRSIIKYQKTSQIRNFNIGPLPFSLNYAKIAKEVVTNDKYGRQTINETIWGRNFFNPINHSTVDYYISSEDFPVLKVIQILSTIFGDYSALKEAIDKSVSVDQRFDSTLNSSFMKSFFPLSHVASNINESKKIFSNQFIFTDEGWSSRPKALCIDLPQFNLLGVPITIDLGWSNTNQYDGSVSFYSNVNDLFKRKVSNNDLDINHIKYIFQLLQTILTFLEDRGWIMNLGITR